MFSGPLFGSETGLASQRIHYKRRFIQIIDV